MCVHAFEDRAHVREVESKDFPSVGGLIDTRGSEGNPPGDSFGKQRSGFYWWKWRISHTCCFSIYLLATIILNDTHLLYGYVIAWNLDEVDSFDTKIFFYERDIDNFIADT